MSYVLSNFLIFIFNHTRAYAQNYTLISLSNWFAIALISRDRRGDLLYAFLQQEWTTPLSKLRLSHWDGQLDNICLYRRRLYTHDTVYLSVQSFVSSCVVADLKFSFQKKRGVWPRTFIDIVITWYINRNVHAKCESSLRGGIVDRITKHQEKSRKR